MHIFFACIVGFLSGSILWSYLLGQLFYDVDIRDYGLDRNPGAMNAFRAKGFWLGASGGLLDALKGFLPVHYFVCDAALVLSPWQMGCVAMSPILGHIFSPFFKGKGGKGVATTVGVWFALGFMHFGLALGMFLCLGELGKFFYFALSSHMVDDAFAVVGGFFGFLIYLYLQWTQLFLVGLMNFCILAYSHRKELLGKRQLIET